jgi:uncharacterized protein (TIGR04255 family)
MAFQEKIKLEDYFNVRPFLAQTLSQDFQTFLVGVELPHEDPLGVAKVQLGTTDAKQAEAIVVLLDITYVLSRPEEIALSQISDHLEKAHENVEEIFETCITDKLRQKFGEVR